MTSEECTKIAIELHNKLTDLYSNGDIVTIIAHLQMVHYLHGASRMGEK